jgi:hypothetical protein
MAGTLLQNLGRYGLPRSSGEALGRFGLDAAFSGLYAATVPGDYASPLERVGLFAEDMATQSLPGIAAAGLTGVAARKLGMGHQRARELAGTADMVGSIAGPMLAGPIGLRPVSRMLDERAMQDAELQRQLELQTAFEQGLNGLGQGFIDTHAVQGVGNTLSAFGL